MDRIRNEVVQRYLVLGESQLTEECGECSSGVTCMKNGRGVICEGECIECERHKTFHGMDKQCQENAGYKTDVYGSMKRCYI